MSTSALIEIKNLRKCYSASPGSQAVLNNINLNIQPTSITGIIGRSGAGKSTLIKCLNLLEKPDSGQILIHQNDITLADSKLLREIRRKIGVIPQSLELLNHRTVSKNISLPLEISGKDSATIHSRVVEMAKLVGIQPHLDAYPKQLSGGQKQRVAIARALVTHPHILLCDEFTSALDAETTREILALIRKVRDVTGVTVVLITHDMSIVTEICDFIYVLNQGVLVEEGKVKDLIQSPKHPVTRALLQSISTQPLGDRL